MRGRRDVRRDKTWEGAKFKLWTAKGKKKPRSSPEGIVVRKSKKSAEKSMVNHPAHYGGKDNVYETIKVLEAWLTPDEYRGFLKGNVIKYLSRARAKGAPIEDQQKAEWYLKALNAFETKHGLQASSYEIREGGKWTIKSS